MTRAYQNKRLSSGMKRLASRRRELLCHRDVRPFPPASKRLQVSVVQNRRVAGKVHAEHIGALGSVDTMRGRLAFWARLPQRLAALGNRVGHDEHAKAPS
jgi:hypothetical protein